MNAKNLLIFLQDTYEQIFKVKYNAT